MLDRIDGEMGLQKQALAFRIYRQGLIASNIANADTPNYKAKDIDFKSALAGALGSSRRDGVSLQRTDARHLAGQSEGPFASEVKYRSEYQGAVDGNTVNMDVERAALTENTVQIEALLTFVRGHAKDLTTAIQGQ